MCVPLPHPTLPPPGEPSVCRIPNLCVQPLTPQIPECLFFSTVKAGGFGERMRREETLSAKGKKRERHIEKKVMEAIRRRPPSPARGTQHITQDVPQPSLCIFRAARCRVPAHRYHQRVRTRKVFARAMAHNTRQPIPRTSTQSAGDLGVPGMGTGEHWSADHAQADTIWTPTHTNDKLSESKQPCQARRGAPFPTTPSHHGHKQLSRGTPRPLPGSSWLT